MHTLDTMFTNYVTKTYNEATHLRNEAHAGDIVAIAGLSDINGGETICDPENPEKKFS
mgnify:CR=1 FL=1